MLGLYILVVSVAVCFIIGALVLSKSTWDKTTATYGALTLTMIGMSVANQLAIEERTNQLLYVRLVMCMSTVAVFLVYLLIIYLGNRDKKPLYESGLFYATMLVAIIDLSDYLFSDVIAGSPPRPVPGPAVSVYFIHFFITFIAALASLYTMRKNTNSTKRRQQYRLLIIGIVPILLLAPLTSFILPNFLGINNFLVLTPLYGMIFAASVGYAVIRHGLFDVKLAVVRSVAYILSIATMAGVYFGLAYFASMMFFSSDITTSVSVSPVNVVLALVLAFIFQPIKKFFDHWTNKIFYRDRYDTDEFIARLGRILTSTTRLHEVLERALREITVTLKSNGGLFVIYRLDHADVLVGRVKFNNFNDEEYALVQRIVEVCGNEVLVVNPNSSGNDNDEKRRLHELLARHKVALVLPLITTNQTIGYLFLGEQMGSDYAKRDIAVLETVADELVIAIQNARSVQEVRDLNTHLEQRIDKATEELRASNKRLVELDTMKDEFVSMASHQLRTPLTSVKGYISMVLEGDAGKITTTQRQLLQEAFTSSERMVHLISDFLNVSRLQTGKFVVDRKEADLAEITMQEVANIGQIAASHQVRVEYKKPARFPILYIDESKIRQVIMNFIDNAIYYSPDTKVVKLTLAVEDGEAVLRVIDQGMGVPKEAQSKLFTKFFRAENARKQRPDGTGVGLFLAKKVIDGHGGSLVFESELGKGSTFGFRLPIRKLSQPPAPNENEQVTDAVAQ